MKKKIRERRKPTHTIFRYNLRFMIALVAAMVILMGIIGAMLRLHYIVYRQVQLALTLPQIRRPAAERKVDLNVRWYSPADNKYEFDTEKDSTYVHETIPLDLRKTALVLMDLWERFPNDGWSHRMNENRKSKIVPLLELARKHNMIVVHATYGYPIAEDCTPLPDEIVLDATNYLDDALELHQYLERLGVETLIYAGYGSNFCLVRRPSGIFFMKRLGYRNILLRDCTIAFETPESLDGEWANRIAINMVEFEGQIGKTSTLKDFEEALEGGAG